MNWKHLVIHLNELNKPHTWLKFQILRTPTENIKLNINLIKTRLSNVQTILKDAIQSLDIFKSELDLKFKHICFDNMNLKKIKLQNI